MTHFIGRSAFVGLTICVAAASQAFTLNFSGLQTGSAPLGGAPWASLTVTDGGVNTVDFTLTHNATSAAGQFLSTLWLNMDPYPAGPAIVESSPKITGASFSHNGINNASLTFDASVGFEVSNAGGGVNRLKPGESVSWQITGTGLNAAAFMATAGTSNVIAMIHVQNIGPNGDSGKIIATVPEPASMSALALALGSLAARRRRK
ncbi:MAG: PEP-CTERM sorting domain-containing protein [Fimbriimonadaceae bacterium]|nr:PEP-CTERM sorting domain-containing protein [Fimbriimonadaceae bacterium]